MKLLMFKIVVALNLLLFTLATWSAPLRTLLGFWGAAAVFVVFHWLAAWLVAWLVADVTRRPRD